MPSRRRPSTQYHTISVDIWMLCNGLRTGFMDFGIYGPWFEHIELCYNCIVWCFIMVNHAEFIIILPNLNIEMLHLVK